MSTGDTRTNIVNEGFVDTFPVFDLDGYSKVAGVNLGDFVKTFRFEGEEIAAPSHVVDEPDSNGEYRITVAPGELSNLGFYQIEVFIPSNKQIWGVGIQVIDNLTDVIQGLYMGSEQVIIDVDDGVGAPIGDVAVQVYDETLSQIVQAGRTNATTGELATTLDPATHKVILSKSLVGFSNPYSIVVADNGGVGVQTFALVGSPLTVQLPVSPSLCRVYGYLQSMTGQYSDVYSILVEGIGEHIRSYVAGSGAVDAEPQGVARDRKVIRPSRTTGVWEVDLVRNAYARIRIEAQGVDKLFRVPDEAVVNFKDVVPLREADFIGSAMGAASPFEVPGP